MRISDWSSDVCSSDLLDHKEIEIKLVNPTANMQLMGPPGMEEMTQQLQSMFANLGQNKTRARKMKIKDAFRQPTDEEAATHVDEEGIRDEVIRNAEQNGNRHIDTREKLR